MILKVVFFFFSSSSNIKTPIFLSATEYCMSEANTSHCRLGASRKKVAFLSTGCPSLQPFVPCAWDCSIIHCRVQSCIALAGAIWHLASLGKRKKFQHHHEENHREKRHRSGCTSAVTQCTTLLRIKAAMKVSYAHQCVVPQKGSHFATTAYAVRGLAS